MFYQRTGINKPHTARFTMVRLLSRVYSPMDHQRRVALKRFRADIARKLFLVTVDQRVTIETVLVDERLVAHATLVRRRSKMLRFVILQRQLLFKLLATV